MSPNRQRSRLLARGPNLSTHPLDPGQNLLAALPERPRVLTTTGEFHSFSRQIARLEEEGMVSVTRVESKPGHAVPERLAAVAERIWYAVVKEG